MAQVVSLQFRPTIIIFIEQEPLASSTHVPNAAGVDAVRAYLRDLCAGLDPVLHPCVQLLALPESERLGRFVSLVTTAGDDADADATPSDFPRLFRAALETVMNGRRIQEIEYAGYPVPIAPAQVFIVARTDTRWAPEVARWVREAMVELRLSTFVGYFLLDVGHFGGTILATEEAAIEDETLPHLEDVIGAANGLEALHDEHPSWSQDAEDSHSRPHIQPPHWVRDLAGTGDMPLVNFCFVFQHMDQRQMFLDGRDVSYALAQALFGMLATSMPAATTFHEAVRVSPNIGEHDVDSRIGSLATSMIFFPRAASERYCCDLFGAELMGDWVSAMSVVDLDEHQRKQMQKRASTFARRIRDALQDGEPRPGLEDYNWPNLSLLGNLEHLAQLPGAMRKIFEPLAYDSVEEAMTERDTFALAAHRREGETIQALHEWRAIAEASWDSVRDFLLAENDRYINTLWLADAHGTALAKEYIEQLDSYLATISNQLGAWRVEHLEDYQADIERLASASDGPWVTPPGEGAITGEPAEATIGPRQAQPTITNPGEYIGLRSGNAFSGSPPDLPPTLGDTSPPGAYADGTVFEPAASVPEPNVPLDPTEEQADDGDFDLPDEVRAMIANLGLRIEYRRSQVPAVSNLVAVSMVAGFPLLLLLFALLPASWSANLPLHVLAGVGLVAAMFALGWLYRHLAVRRVAAAEDDLLEAYCVSYLYLCRDWEDQLRVVVLSPLIRDVKLMRERLEEMSVFLTRIAQELTHAAGRTETELFDGPSSLRAVFIANRQELSRQGYTLRDFYQEVRRQALAGGDTGVVTTRELNARLRQHFAQTGGNILKLENHRIATRIQEFCRTIILPILTGDLVSIGAALNAPGDTGTRIWQRALGKSTVLYRPYNNAPILSYVCARDEHRATIPAQAVPAATTMVATSNAEWLLVARLWTGGGGTPWSAAGMWESRSLPQRLVARPAWVDGQN